ncbi:MAG: hypothetical protein WC384_07935 [Prolixibacteraceae bacterium]|jgi:hypothetical protein
MDTAEDLKEYYSEFWPCEGIKVVDFEEKEICKLASDVSIASNSSNSYYDIRNFEFMKYVQPNSMLLTTE